MRKIAVITGSRGEYGYIRPILKLIQKTKALEYAIVASNLHLLSAFGKTVNEIENDGFEITDRIFMALDGYTPTSMNKSMGVFMISIADTLSRLKPDIILLAGDRGEQLMAAMAAFTMNIPVAHIQAGERSGNVDGMTRHAITRFAHLHFASGEDATERLRKMGEQEFRIHMTGAPQLDELVTGAYKSAKDVAEELRLDLSKPILLVVQHPVIEDSKCVEWQANEVLEAVSTFGYQTVIVFPNNDAGSQEIRNAISRYSDRPNFRVSPSMPRDLYLGLLKVCSCIVGNSSSGIIEAPVFEIPAVNVGTRQRDRYCGNNVISTPYRIKTIIHSIKTAFHPSFAGTFKFDPIFPYFADGKASERIVRLLETTPLDEQLMTKQIAY